MKLLRYVIFVAISTIVVPFLGVPMGWKQGIFVALGVTLLITVVFLKKAITTCSHEDRVADSGSSFQDSEFKEDVVVDVVEGDVEEVDDLNLSVSENNEHE